MYELSLRYEPIREDHSATSRFELVQYFDTSFDFNFPFRPVLEFIAVCLRNSGKTAEAEMPGYYKFEDFVTGCLTIDDREVSVYFEHALGFVSFGSNDREDVRLIVDASEGRTFCDTGYGLDDAQW